MLDDKQKLLDKNILINMRKKRKTDSAYEKARKLCFFLSILFSLLIIGSIYYFSEYSHIYRITATGNVYLKDSDIIKMSGLSVDSRYLLTVPKLVEKKIKENKLIEDCKVSLKDGRLVEINVREKKIIGYLPENGLNVLILEDNERIPVNKENMYLINAAPLIEGFSEEETILLEKQLSLCDYKIINEISEIHYYPDLKYQYVELIMRDGNYVFTSPYGLSILNHFYDIESSLSSGVKRCYYFEDISGNAYTTACPWEEIEEEEKSEEDNKEDTSEEEDDE